MRAFIGIPLDAAAQAEIGALQDSLRTLPALEEFRWVAPRNVHLTLRFLGDIDESRAAAAGDAVAASAGGIPSFWFVLERFGVFPHLRRPGVLWVGPNEMPGPLADLAAGLSEALAGAGFEREERPFRAHLTIGRRRGGRPPAGLEGELEAAEQRWLVPPPRFRAGSAVLFKSELKPGGAIYTPVRTVPLA